MSKEPVIVLVADDNENDQWLMRRAFETVARDIQVDFVRDGQETIDYLVINSMPSLLILDHKMTRLNAFGVLKWLREDDTFKDLPVVIVSGMKSADDEGNAIKLGARAYYSKPYDFADMKELVRTLLRYCNPAAA
jgi:CheY-like chemotaxis protein